MLQPLPLIGGHNALAAEKLVSVAFLALRCHPEPFACHSERSEESRSAAQGKLREEPVLNEVKESRSGLFSRQGEIPRRPAAPPKVSRGEKALNLFCFLQVTPFSIAKVLRSTFMGSGGPKAH